MSLNELTSSSLLAAATEVLTQGGYERSAEPVAENWTSTSRLFEDQYGVVSIIVHDTWKALEATWHEDQARFVELLAQKVGQSEAKAWEGYLVLLTPGRPATEEERLVARQIRYDTSRVRKLVVSASEVTSISEVERALASLLPLPEAQLGLDTVGVLGSLPPLLAEEGIPHEHTERLIEAFEHQTSLLAALSEGRGSE